MAARVVDLCDALVSFLNAQTYSIAFNATRRYMPVSDLAELADTQVSVFPGTIGQTVATRALYREVYKLYIGVQKALEGNDEASQIADCDGQMLLAEEIRDSLQGEVIGGFGVQELGEETDQDLYSADAMHEIGVSSVLVTVTFEQ